MDGAADHNPAPFVDHNRRLIEAGCIAAARL
jgi:hypothetical protein